MALLVAAAPLAAGTYSLVIDVVGKRSVPLVGEVDARTRTTAVWKIDADGNADETPCAFTSESTFFNSRATPATMKSRPRLRYHLGVDGNALHVDLGVFHVGLVGDVLPVDDKDPRAVDADGDGKPGAAFDVDALLLGKLTIEVAALWHVALVGTVDDAHHAHGRVRATIDERALSGLPLGELGPMHVDADKSSFHIAPVATFDCAALR